MLLVLVLAARWFEEAPGAFPTQPCGPGPTTGCYTNYARLEDLDGDGDLDALFPNAAGYFTQGTSQPFVIYRNDGGTFTDVSSSLDGGASGWVRQVAIGDIDADGDLDLFAPDAWGGADSLFVNDGAGAFADEAAARIGSSSRAGATRFADVDGDGDLDLWIADWGSSPPSGAWSMELYRNDGTGSFTSITGLPDTSAADGTGPVDIDPFDIDGDFDLDLLIGTHEGNLQLWRNDGASFTDVSDSFANQQPSFHYGPAVCDIDGDGDLDVWVDNAAAGYEEQLLVNSAGTFLDATSLVSGNNGADDNGLACVDVDGDGDLDAAIASLSDEERVLVSTNGGFVLDGDGFSPAGDSTLWFDFGDLDGDGRLDVVTGQGETGSFLNRAYFGTAAVPPDARPPIVRVLEQVDEDSNRIRFALVDSAVTDAGPRVVDPEIEMTLPDGPVVLPARWVGGDLFASAMPAFTTSGTVSYRACATDAAGNRGCGESMSFAVVTPGGDDDDDGGGGGGCGCATTRGAGSIPWALIALLVVRRARRSLLCGSNGPARCPRK